MALRDPERGSFRSLVVWQREIELNVAIYKATANFPDAEKFGLISQLRRTPVSVASNISEGYGKATRGEYLQFLGHARGSNCELQTQLIISSELEMGSRSSLERAEALSIEIGKMLVALMKRLRE